MPRLTLRGVAFIVAGVGFSALAYALERPELLTMAALAVAAPLMAFAVVATSRVTVRVTRRLDPVVATERDVVRVEVSVTGRARAAEWLERVPMSPGFAGPGRLSEVRTARPASLAYRYWPAARGLVDVGPLLIEDRDPFALAVRVTDTRQMAVQLVIPAVTVLDPGPIPDPSSDSGPRTARSRERSDDDVVTREYRDGDALRRVHWRVTARQGELMVRQDEPQAGPRARVLIDAGVQAYADAVTLHGRGPAHSGTFEWVVRMAASCAVHLSERGYGVDLATPTEREGDPPVADGPVGNILGELAVLQLAPSLLGADDDARGRPRGASLPLVAISACPDEATVQWMLSQRAVGAPAVALLAGPVPAVAAGQLDPDPARDALERAGWRVTRVPLTARPDEAWWSLLGGGGGGGGGSGVGVVEAPAWAGLRVVPRG